MTPTIFWLSIIAPFRAAIIFFVFLLLLRFLKIPITGILYNFIFVLINGVSVIIFTVLEYILIFIAKGTSLSNETLNLKIEKVKINFITRVENNIKKNSALWSNRRLALSPKIETIIIIPIICFVVLNFMPNSIVANWWYKAEEKVMQDYLNTTYISTEEARAIYALWRESQSEEDSDIHFILVEDVGGGNVRESPSKSSNVITSVSPEESFKYLGESSVDEENREWIKVETVYGDIGWISSRIVQEK